MSLRGGGDRVALSDRARGEKLIKSGVVGAAAASPLDASMEKLQHELANTSSARCANTRDKLRDCCSARKFVIFDLRCCQGTSWPRSFVKNLQLIAVDAFYARCDFIHSLHAVSRISFRKLF